MKTVLAAMGAEINAVSGGRRVMEKRKDTRKDAGRGCSNGMAQEVGRLRQDFLFKKFTVALAKLVFLLLYYL